MVYKLFRRTLRTLNILEFCNSHQKRLLSSALYLTGDKARSNFAYISPVLDFQTKFQNLALLEKNVQLRGIPVNVYSIQRMWDFKEGIRATKEKIELRRSEINKAIQELMNSDTPEAKCELEKLKALAHKIKRELKVITAALWDLEGKIVPKFLSIPNVLHERTPEKKAELLHTFLEPPMERQALSHVEIGSSLGLLKCIGPLCSYLKNDAVKFEMGSLKFFVDHFRERDYVQFSNPDFVKSVVIEGCGMDHEDPFSTFILERDVSDDADESNPNRLHLLGGAAMGPFCSYFSKQVAAHPLPIKLIAAGRQYNSLAIQTKGSLLNSCQASAVQFFICLENSGDLETKTLDDVLEQLITAYQDYGYHFRVVYIPAAKLSPWESLRASIQMYSSYLQSYIEVGNVSLCGDYISKRLLMYYQTPEKGFEFLRVLSGTAISVPRVLACVLEDSRNYCNGKLFLPSHLENVFQRQ